MLGKAAAMILFESTCMHRVECAASEGSAGPVYTSMEFALSGFPCHPHLIDQSILISYKACNLVPHGPPRDTCKMDEMR